MTGTDRKVFLRAFRSRWDRENRQRIGRDMAKWSLWYYPLSWFELYWEVILIVVYSEDIPAAFCLHFVNYPQVPMCRLLECILVRRMESSNYSGDKWWPTHRVIQQIIIDSLIGKRDLERRREVRDVAVWDEEALCLGKCDLYIRLQ